MNKPEILSAEEIESIETSKHDPTGHSCAYHFPLLKDIAQTQLSHDISFYEAEIPEIVAEARREVVDWVNSILPQLDATFTIGNISNDIDGIEEFIICDEDGDMVDIETLVLKKHGVGE